MNRTRKLAVTLLFSTLPVGLWACIGDDTVVPLGDAGGTDATLDGTDDGESEAEAAAEASCAVDAGPLDDAQVALGATIISTHRCFQCHGQTLSGNNDGVIWAQDEGGFAYPPNLTSDPATGLGCWSNDQIENAILNGIDNEGMPLCPPMPRFGHIDDGGLDAAQVQAVIQYLRSIPVYVNQVANTNCSFADAGPEASPEEAGPEDAGPEAGVDATTSDASDGGFDATVEAGADAQEAGGD
ncbi:MAG TPA: c-type cytochrome [Polyangiaceae bacterium]